MTGKKKTVRRPKSSKPSTNVAAQYPASVISMAARNLINMVAVSAVSGTVLLALMIVKRL